MSVSASKAGSELTVRFEAAAAGALAAANEALAHGTTAGISDEALQQLFEAGTRLFARKVEEERRYFLPLSGKDAVTPTDAAVTVLELLRAVDLNLFDLSMWAGRPRDPVEHA